jgi:hypothetical protein
MMNKINIRNKQITLALFLGLFGILLSFASVCLAAPPDGNDQSAGKMERVGGTYLVTAINKIADNAFQIEFKSTVPSGHFDILRLESDHVHMAVKIGQRIRLSAEILAVDGAVAEVSQVLLFLNTQQGRVPVWLLSNKAKEGSLRAAEYLEMHVPATDYIIL